MKLKELFKNGGIKNGVALIWRRFKIWQRTGKHSIIRKDEDFAPIECNSCGRVITTPYCPHCGQSYRASKKSFFKGSFDSIPFLNDDAKRTFIHLLLRPGYMIRDYLSGQNSRYLAPMTALIIFYAFFSLMSSILNPEMPGTNDVMIGNDMSEMEMEGAVTIGESDTLTLNMANVGNAVFKAYCFFNLDKHPEMVTNRMEASLASLEGALRSQGIFAFIWQLIALTLSMWIVFGRREHLGFTACATTSAYILCQFCFFMMFTLLFTFGREENLGMLLIALILVYDFCQMFGYTRRKSLRKTILIGLIFLILMILFLTLAATAMILIYGM